MVLGFNGLTLLEFDSERPEPLAGILLSWAVDRAHALSELAQEVGLNLDWQDYQLVLLTATQLKEDGVLPLMLVHQSLIQCIWFHISVLDETWLVNILRIQLG